MMVRAKFVCVNKTANDEAGVEGCVTLEAVHSGSKENEDFFHWTPSGRIEMGTINKKAFEQFVIGGEYFVDFTPATS